MIYLLCFAVSVVFCSLANRAKNKGLFIVLSILSILPTVALAGLRDMSIGIDVKNYYNFERYWQGAVNADSVADYMKFYLSNSSLEPLFALYMGLIAQLTGNYRVFLTLSHLLIVVFMYVGLFRLKKHVNPAFTLLLFYTLYYNNSLNIIRQYIAMAIVFAAFADIEQDKHIRYTLIVCITSLIHVSTLLSFIPLYIYYVLYRNRKIQKVSLFRKFVMCIIIAVMAVSALPIVELLLQKGILPSKYWFYIRDEKNRISITMTVLLMLEVTGLVLNYKRMTRYDSQGDLYVMCSVTFLVLQMLSAYITYGKRISAHLSFANMVTLGMFARYQRKAVYRLIWFAMIAFFVLYYWVYMYVLARSSETYPYLLGI